MFIVTNGLDRVGVCVRLQEEGNERDKTILVELQQLNTCLELQSGNSPPSREKTKYSIRSSVYRKAVSPAYAVLNSDTCLTVQHSLESCRKILGL